MKFVPLLFATTSLAACAVVGPDYASPSVTLAQRFALAQSDGLQAAAHDRWWTTLGDPVLVELMDLGLRSNLDIRTALARIAESEALLAAEGVAASQLSGDLVAEATRIRTGGTTVGTESGTLNGRFVFDLFGGFSRRRERARAALEAATFEAGAARLAFQAELAGAVIEARFFQAALRVTERTIASRRRILGSTNELVRSGLLTRESTVRARAELAQAQADLPTLRNGIHLSAVRAAVLLDRPVAFTLDRLRGSSGSQPMPKARIAPGVPADLLRNRPDVIAAERRLAAAFAEIGIAEAALYPALSLDGSIRLDGSANAFQLGPRLSLPVLGRGRLVSLRRASEARAVQAELAWRTSVRDAVGDVERALANIDSARAEIAALQQASREFRTLVSLSRETFAIGATTLLELLDAEQEVQTAERALAASRRDLALATARLAVATGRGYAVGLAEPAPAVAVASKIDG